MGFIGDLLSVESDYRASPTELAQSQYGDIINQAGQMALQSPQAGAATAGRQTALADQLIAQTQGQGPSLAQMLLQQASNQAQQQSAGMLGAQRGMNPALAQRLVAQNQANAGQQLAGQAGILRLQEQQGAQQQLAGLLGTQRQQDIGQQEANTNLFSSAGQLQNAQNLARIQNQYGYQGINANTAMANQQAANALTGSLIEGGAALAGSAIAGKFSGGYIGGQAEVKGDSPKNDVVPAMLSPGEIVIPRSKATDPEKAKEFIDQLMKSKKKTDYNDVLAAKRKAKK